MEAHGLADLVARRAASVGRTSSSCDQRRCPPASTCWTPAPLTLNRRITRMRSTSCWPAARASRPATRARDVSAGDTIYVPAGVPHHFHDITERLELMVVFAPPET